MFLLMQLSHPFTMYNKAQSKIFVIFLNRLGRKHDCAKDLIKQRVIIPCLKSKCPVPQSALQYRQKIHPHCNRQIKPRLYRRGFI